MLKFLVRTMSPVLLGAVFTSTAFADGITLSGDFPGGYLSYTFTDEAGDVVQEYVSPYTATSTIGGKTIASQFACLDINNPTDVGTFYSGYFGYAATTADDEVSWLADQLAGTNPNNPSPYTGPISMAIWQIEFPSSTDSEGGSDPIDPAAQVWVDDAEWEVLEGGYKADSVFFSPTNSDAQRFVEISLTDEPGTLGLIPEPGTLGMMGAGLLGLAGLLRRKLPR
ncbi:MAG: PEP-CTERM sorting domain-containing protein [Terracidiphilus sp.]|jgi:hypothetical protein